MLKYQDAPTILGFICTLLGTISDRVNPTVNKVNAITDTRSTSTGFHEPLYPEYHHLTRKHAILGLNHLNGQTPVNPRLMHPLQYMDP